MIRTLATVVAACLSFVACDAPRPELARVADPSDARRIGVVLDRYGVSGADIEEAGRSRDTVWSVRVDDHQLATARAILDVFGLPRRARPGIDGLRDQSGYAVGSEMKDRFLVRKAHAEEVERNLLVLERVRDVHVAPGIYDPGEVGDSRYRADERGLPLPDLRTKATVSVVWLRLEPGQGPPLTEEEVRNKVAAGFVGLDPARLEVTMQAIDVPAFDAVPPRARTGAAVTASSPLLIATFLLGISSIVLTVLLLRARSTPRRETSRPVAVRAAA